MPIAPVKQISVLARRNRERRYSFIRPRNDGACRLLRLDCRGARIIRESGHSLSCHHYQPQQQQSALAAPARRIEDSWLLARTHALARPSIIPGPISHFSSWQKAPKGRYSTEAGQAGEVLTMSSRSPKVSTGFEANRRPGKRDLSSGHILTKDIDPSSPLPPLICCAHTHSRTQVDGQDIE